MSGAVLELRRRLPRTEPCQQALDWLEAGGYPSLQAAWEVCQRGDWMAWLANLLLRGDTEAGRAYNEATATARRVCEEAMATSWRAMALRAYWAAAAMALRAYWEATATAGRKILPVLPPELGGAA